MSFIEAFPWIMTGLLLMILAPACVLFWVLALREIHGWRIGRNLRKAELAKVKREAR